MGANISLLRVWASAGSLAQPSNAKIDLGWSAGEQPAVEWWNWGLNTRESKINEILAYLNNGVPLSDLKPGAVVLGGSSNSLQMGLDTSYHSIVTEESFRAFDPNKAAYTGTESDGINILGEDGSHTKSGRVVVVDISSGLAWTDLGGGIQYTGTAFGITNLPFITANIAFGASVIGRIESSNTTYYGAVTKLQFTDGSPETVCSQLHIHMNTTPGSLDSLLLVFHIARPLAFAPSSL